MDMFTALDLDERTGPTIADPVSVAPADNPVATSAPPTPPSFPTAPAANRTEIAITTELGTFIVELFADTPVSTAKFIDNVVRDLYSGGNSSVMGDAFIHRRDTDFVMQGGGYYQNGENTYAPIIPQVTGEVGVHTNAIYTLSWALTGTDPATAGSQWFINLRDNAVTLSQFPVFGQLVGLSGPFNAAATLPTLNLGSPFNQLPVLHGATQQTFTTNDILRVTYDVLGVAAADSASTGEATVLAGSSVLANDTDLDSTLSIALINGSAVAFGSTLTLTSGAKLTVNANGTYSYDPNHAFDALNTGQSATDSFTYALAGGHLVTGTATVTITINGASTTPVNHAPSGADSTTAVQHRVNHIVTLAEFGFSDSDGNAFASVTIDTYPTAGRLLYQAVPGGVAALVTAGQVISAADIAAGKLIYSPTPAASGPGGSLTFQVHDNGGTAGGGVDTDPTPNTLIFNPNGAMAGAGTNSGLILAGDVRDHGHDVGALVDTIIADRLVSGMVHDEALPAIHDMAPLVAGHHIFLDLLY